MMTKKISVVLALSVMVIFVFSHCSKETEVAETPKTEEMKVALSPTTQEVKGDRFNLQLSDLEITGTVDKGTKELTQAPSLRGNIKLTNQSRDILDVQGVTFQYLDKSGNPIPFKTGEKNVTVSAYWKDLQPGTETAHYVDVNVPAAAVKEKSLEKIQVRVVYIPSPLKREALDVPVKMEAK